jgi:hypothetical protein
MNTTFTETQKFNKWWHYVIAGFPIVLIIALFIPVWLDVVTTKNNQKEPLFFLISFIFTTLAFIWFVLLKLKTQINEEGILVIFSGLPFCKRKIKWEEIKSISIIKYEPLTDYGGWGVRYSLSGNGWCYNVSGNYGIKIIYQNNKPFLIGTQQKEEAEKIINLYFKK